MSNIQIRIQNVHITNVLIQTPISNHSHPKCLKPNCPFRMTMIQMANTKQGLSNSLDCFIAFHKYHYKHYL